MSKFKVGDEKLYCGEWCKVERAVGQCYEMVFKGGDHRLIQECRLTPFEPAPAETDRERRGRECYEQHCKHLHEAAPDISTLPWDLVQSYEKQSWGADAAEYPDRRELTDEDVERAAIAYVNARADSHNPNWYGSTETLRENVRGYMRAALTAIGALPHRYSIGVDMASPGGDYTAKREPTEDEVERVANAVFAALKEHCSPCKVYDMKGKHPATIYAGIVYKRAAHAAIAAMNPLTAVTISDEELGDRIAGYGALPKCTRRNIAIDARELLAANSVEVDFVATSHVMGAKLESVSQRARAWIQKKTKGLIARDGAYVISAIECIRDHVVVLQHEGFVVLVR